MRYAIIALILIFPAAALAGEHAVQRGESTKVSITVDHMRETMIVLPEVAASVTGVGEPSFQIEPGPDYVMLRALTPSSRGNLFINLGNKTIVSLQISTTQSGGEQLVALKYSAPAAYSAGAVHGNMGSDADVRSLAGPWRVKKLGSKSKNSGFTANATYALEIGDKIYVNFRITNDTDQALSISDISLVRNTLGGLKGLSVMDTTEIPSECALDVRSLSPGEDAYGTLVFPKTYVDFDQTLILRVHNSMSEGPELRIAL